MKKNIIKVTLTLTIITGLVIVWNNFNSEPENLDELLEGYENPGLKIEIGSPFSGSVLVANKGNIVFHKAYGSANRELKIPNKIDTKFGIGSITKQFTAMLVLQLVEKGQINLNDTIGEYLPYLPAKMGHVITVHQLLSHTSGLPHYEGLQVLGLVLNDFGSTKFTPKSLAELIGKTSIINQPGTSYSYSSLGYDLLGAIVEQVSGKNYAELLEESIVKPLGLKNTGFESNSFIKNELAKGYRYREVYGKDWWFSEHGGEISEPPFRDQSTAYATGGMHSTVEDLFIWSEAIKSNRLLSAELMHKMLTPNMDGYCYGWVKNPDNLIESNTKVRLYAHGGALAGNTSYIAMYEDGTTIIFLANMSNIKAEEMIHQMYLKTHHLEDKYKLQGYPDRSSYSNFIAAGGIPALIEYFDNLSNLTGYTVHPSKYTMSGVMKIYLEEDKLAVADSLKNVFLKLQNHNEGEINEVGYSFLQSDYVEFSLDFFKYNAENHPYSSNVWDSLGEAYFENNQIEKSIECYSKAVEIGEVINHKSLDSYRDSLQKVKDKLKG